MPRRSPQTQKRVDLTPERPDLAKSGEFPAAPPRNRAAGDLPPPLARPNPLRRPIRIQRARLDLGSIRSRPPDLNPMAWIPGYRFGRCLLLKSPPGSEYLTRSPPSLKTNCSLALFYSRTPLSFTRFEPAVHPWRFCTLDPGTNV